MSRFVVRLSGEKRERLAALIWKEKSPARRVLKARILLKADVSEGDKGWSDNRIIDAEGFEAVLSRKPRAMPAIAYRDS